MDERDFWGIFACVLALTGLALLHSKLIAMTADKLADVSADVEFLKDHSVARETEARP